MRHDMESCDQGGEDQDKTWLDGLVASVKGKLSDDLVLMDEDSGLNILYVDTLDAMRIPRSEFHPVSSSFHGVILGT